MDNIRQVCKHQYLSLIVISIVLASQNVAAAVTVYAGKIETIIVPVEAVSDIAIVQFQIADPNFLLACRNNRVKFSKANKEAYSYILSLYMSGKNVAFYVDTNGTTLGSLPGHGAGSCELRSIWGDKPQQ